MSNKHTPGPWTVPARLSDLRPSRVVRSAEHIITLAGGADRVEQHANACLIAAAPDLLAACEFVRERALAHSDPDDVDHAAYKRVSAAIAKAKGETK